MATETRTYEALESFAVRSGVQILPGETVELTDDEARAFLYYGRIRPSKRAGPMGVGGTGVSVETRDPAPRHRR